MQDEEPKRLADRDQSRVQRFGRAVEPMDVLDHQDKRREAGSGLDDPAEEIARLQADQQRHQVPSRRRAAGRNPAGFAEAEAYFRKALAAYEQNPSCAEPLPATRAVVGLLETLMLKSDYREAGNIADKLMPIVKQAGESRS
jgi:hypothetical protein